MTKLNTKSPLKAYANIASTLVIVCLRRRAGCRSGVDRRSREQRPQSLVGPWVGEGGVNLRADWVGNRMGHHARKKSRGRTIDFFKQQSKKSKDITGRCRGVGGLNRWVAWHGWNPAPHAQSFFRCRQVLRRPNRGERFKSLTRTMTSRRAGGVKKQKLGIYFLLANPAVFSVWKNAAKFRVGGGPAVR
jgi:hypothetical protein